MSGTARNVVQAAHIGSVTFVEPSPRPVVPAQADPPPSAFVNRDDQLALLRERATAVRLARPEVVTVHGMQGVGKTALLRQFAATAGDLFPDGVLSVTFGPQERAPGEAAATFLVGLGMPEQHIPSTTERRVAMYRSMSAGLRLLVLLDDVTDDEQVSALLPNSPGSMVLAAGNRVFEGLYADGAVPVPLRSLSVEHGVRLLDAICGDQRIAEDPESARALVAAFDGLPLAIGVAGARLAAHRSWPVARLLEEVGDADGRTVKAKVFATFDLVYGELREPLRRLYRSLGTMVGVHFGIELLAAASARSVRAARADVDDLVQVGLVEEAGLDTFRLHRMVREHALHRSADEDDLEVRRGWRRRAVRWWLFGAMAADLAADPDRLRVPDAESVRGERPAGVSAAAGVDWLDREHANLLAAMEAAEEEGWHAEVCRLFEALFALYKTRKPLSSWVRAGTIAVRSASMTGHAETESRCRCLLAKAYQELERFDEAHAELTIARRLVADGAERFAAATYDFTGNLYLRQGDAAVALGWFQRALAVNRRLGLVRGTALQSMLVGRALGRLDRFDEALDMFAAARDLVTGGSAAVLLPKILAATGAVLARAGRAAEADRALLAAVDLAVDHGTTADAVDALITLADLGGADAAEHRARAVQLLERMGSPLAAKVITA
ncbi:NB-ARC domain-containing protein [Actinophytocola sediminis]